MRLRGEGVVSPPAGPDGALYRPADGGEAPAGAAVALSAVPYYAWANRARGRWRSGCAAKSGPGRERRRSGRRRGRGAGCRTFRDPGCGGVLGPASPDAGPGRRALESGGVALAAGEGRYPRRGAPARLGRGGGASRAVLTLAMGPSSCSVTCSRPCPGISLLSPPGRTSAHPTGQALRRPGQRGRPPARRGR